MKVKRIVLLLVSSLLLSCSNKTNYEIINHYTPGYMNNGEYLEPLDTIVSLKMFNKEEYEATYNEFDNIVQTLSKECDAYHDYQNINNIKTINDSYGTNKYIQISDNLFDLLKLGVKLTKITKGTFNIAMGSLIDMYENYYDGVVHKLPDLSLVLSSIPSYEDIENIIDFDENTKSVKLNVVENLDAKIKLNLGAIAKGYVIDKAIEFLKNKNYPAIVNAGTSTIATLNTNPNPERNSWAIGISLPTIYSEDNFTNIFLNGEYHFSTSAINQQYFILPVAEGYEIKSHILDSNKGTSNNYHSSITLLDKTCSLAILDALSTAMFNIENISEMNNLITAINSEYNCNINYIILDSINKKVDKIENLSTIDYFDAIVSDSLKEAIGTNYSSKVRNIKSVSELNY